MASEEPRCQAETKAGQPCRNRPAKGTDRCRAHALSQDLSEPTDMGPNEAALSRTLGSFGQMEDADAARWQMLRSLARAVDTAPTRAALWTEYREALSDLMKEARDADSSLEQALEALRSAASVGDSKD